jgi:uncharacterized protein YcnI
VKKISSLQLFVLATTFFCLSGIASAHVVVNPKEVGVGKRLNFVVSVPTEENVPTISVRLLIPEGMASVRPNVKPSWNIQLKKEGTGEDAKVVEIIWSGGKIPAEQRDEFVFSAQAPAAATTLVWKAYQTYANGTIVAWDADPKTIPAGEHNHSELKPWSETKVINDLVTSPSPSPEAAESSDSGSWQSILALVLSVAALAVAFQSRTRKPAGI